MRVNISRRLAPLDSALGVALITGLSVLAALVAGGLLMLPFHANPAGAYLGLFEAAFTSWRGFGFTLVKASPLMFIGFATICAWRSGFIYLGFEGCLLVGAASATWWAMQALPGGPLEHVGFALFLPSVILVSLLAGACWSGFVGFCKSRFGGNEVIVSLMMNYVAVLLVQYLVSGPLRAPGDLPVSPHLPRQTWLPYLFEGSRAHLGVVLALAAAVLVWVLMLRSRFGFELILAGLNPKAARYGGVPVGTRQLAASLIAGGLAALAGTVDILGVHHRLVDGLAEGTGFIGIVVALLGRLNPFGCVVAAVLYAGLTVGADAMQRRAGLPASVIFIVQSLIVLFVLAGDVLRRYRVAVVRR